jgi:two-component system, OmpR family, sensor histidine kinase TctE
MFRSLRRQLLGWVLVPLALTGALDTWLTYRSAVATASVVQDRLLLGSARMIAEQIRFEDGAFEHQIPPAALELFQSEGLDRIYYRVTAGDGRLLSGYSDLPSLEAPSEIDSPHFVSTVMREQPVRMVWVSQSVIGSPLSKPAWVQVAQTMHEHQQIVAGLWWRALQQQVLILVLTGSLILLGMHRGMRGLLLLRNVVRSRRDGALDPLEVTDIPLELAPIVAALNDYIARLNQGFSQRNSYLQNAAHQLRTPLTVLATQLSDASRATSTDELSLAVASAKRTLQQTTNVVNQYLGLSAAEAFVMQLHPMNTDDFAVIAQETLERLAPQAHRKNIDLGFERRGQDTTVMADATAAREILRNLLDNAIQYTPDGGIVTVRLCSSEATVQLQVEDAGPGIRPEDRERIFERFVRLEPISSEGSGLGLAIVKEIAKQCGADVRLDTPEHGGVGLRVTVDFID